MATGAARAMRAYGAKRPVTAPPAPTAMSARRVTVLVLSATAFLHMFRQPSSPRRGGGNSLDFDQHAGMRERSHADERAGRRIIIAEVAPRDLVENVLAIHLRRKNGQLEHILHLRPRRIENFLDVEEGALGLLLEISLEPLPLLIRIVRVLVIDRHRAAAGEEDQAASFDRKGSREGAPVFRPHRDMVDRLDLHSGFLARDMRMI